MCSSRALAALGVALALSACEPNDTMPLPPPPAPTDDGGAAKPPAPIGNGDTRALHFGATQIGLGIDGRIEVSRWVAVPCGEGCVRVEIVPITDASARLDPPLADLGAARLTAAGAAVFTLRGKQAGTARLEIEATAGGARVYDGVRLAVVMPELFALGCDLDGFSLSQGVLAGSATTCELSAFASDRKLGSLLPRPSAELTVTALNNDGGDDGGGVFALAATRPGRGSLLATAGGQVFLGEVDVVGEDEIQGVALLDTEAVRALPDVIKMASGSALTVRPQVFTSDGRSALGFEDRLVNATPELLRVESTGTRRVRVSATKAGIGTLFLDVAGRRWEIPVLVD